MSLPAAAQDLQSLARKLDAIYLETLDRLEQQTRDSILIDQALRRLLDQDGDQSVLQWDPERAMPPHAAFRSLALKLIERAHAITSHEFPLLETHYADLLSWSAEPRRYELPPSEQFIARINYARAQSLQAFWLKLSTRLVPDARPYDAEVDAVADLATCFGKQVPEAVLIPTVRHPGSLALVLLLPRGFREQAYSLSSTNLERLCCGVQAISTLLLLQRQVKSATALNEAVASLTGRLRASFGQYAHKDTYYWAETGTLVLFQDHIQLRIPQELFSPIQDAALRHLNNPQFVGALLTEYQPAEA
jgi:hypothetical protein